MHGIKHLFQDSLTSYIYALTHVVINASSFYQQYVNYNDCSWIFDSYRSNYIQILKKASPDIIAEVGLSYKLCRQTRRPEFSKLQKHLMKFYNSQLGMIPRKNTQSLNSIEHRNTLAIMALYKFNKLTIQSLI